VRARTQDSNNLNYVRVKVKVKVKAKKVYRGNRGTAPIVLNVSTRCEGLAEISLGMDPCPLNRRVRGPQCRTGRFETETNLFFHYSDSNPGPPSPQSNHYYFLAV
jgi:hypothetical protein